MRLSHDRNTLQANYSPEVSQFDSWSVPTSLAPAVVQLGELRKGLDLASDNRGYSRMKGHQIYSVAINPYDRLIETLSPSLEKETL